MHGRGGGEIGWFSCMGYTLLLWVNIFIINTLHHIVEKPCMYISHLVFFLSSFSSNEIEG